MKFLRAWRMGAGQGRWLVSSFCFVLSLSSPLILFLSLPKKILLQRNGVEGEDGSSAEDEKGEEERAHVWEKMVLYNVDRLNLFTNEVGMAENVNGGRKVDRVL